jgi:hypothetical protein
MKPGQETAPGFLHGAFPSAMHQGGTATTASAAISGDRLIGAPVPSLFRPCYFPVLARLFLFHLIDST